MNAQLRIPKCGTPTCTSILYIGVPVQHSSGACVMAKTTRVGVCTVSTYTTPTYKTLRRKRLEPSSPSESPASQFALDHRS